MFALFLLTFILRHASFSIPCFALDQITFRQDGQQHKVSGKLLLTAQDGGLMLLGHDGAIWAIQPQELFDRKSDDAAFEPFSPDELSRQLVAELPPGFDVYRTGRYLIVYNTSRDYAQWCGALFNRLYAAFTNHWEKRGFALAEPEFPLVAIVFRDRTSYSEHARAEVGAAAESIIGYYSLKTNRMTMYDLSGTSGESRSRGRGAQAAQIQRVLSQPSAAWNVATIVHEATHQIAFNCGLHTRFSDCPRWFSEGIAMYFETPDLSSSKGWSGLGAVNRPRVARFHSYMKTRPADSLTTLLVADKRFLDTETSNDAYAEAWALTYFLLKQYPKQYLAYLQVLSAKKPMIWDEPKTRLQQFHDAFGDPQQIEREFLRFMQRLR